MQETCAQGQLTIDAASIERLTSSFFLRAGRGQNEDIHLEDFRNVMRRMPELVQSFHDRSSDVKADEASSSAILPSWLQNPASKALAFFRVSLQPHISGFNLPAGCPAE